MKTQIITLESHDDLISVRDRMSWAKTARILLVWPKYEKVTLRQVDLKVLQRHASSLGAQLGLVTRRRNIRADAEELGIPVFESTGQAQRVSWPEPSVKKLERKTPDKTLREKREQARVKEEAWRVHPITRVLFFIIGVSSVLALAAVFIPRAQVQLKPQTRMQDISVPVSASMDVKDVFISGSIPAYEKRIVVDGTQSVLVTGEGQVPQSNAKGTALFRNLTQNEVILPVGTVVRSGEVRFATTKEGVIAAGVGKTAEVPIEAVDGGPAGNMDAGVIDIIEGRLGLLVSVTNLEPTSGGRERASVQATDADRERAKKLLLDALEADARINMLDGLSAGDVVFDETFEISQVLSENFDLPSGAAATQLTLTMQAEFVVLYTSASDLTELATLALNASLPSGFSSTPEAIHYESVTDPLIGEDGIVRWAIRAERKIVEQTDNAQVTQLILGLRTSEAQSQLDRFLPQSAPNLILFPSWWPWVPLAPFRIEVVTQ